MTSAVESVNVGINVVTTVGTNAGGRERQAVESICWNQAVENT